MNIQMKQAPNRKGNHSDKPPVGTGRMNTVGVTNVTANTINISQPKGAQGAPKSSGNVNNARPDKVLVSVAKDRSSQKNDGYRAGSSFLK